MRRNRLFDFFFGIFRQFHVLSQYLAEHHWSYPAATAGINDDDDDDDDGDDDEDDDDDEGDDDDDNDDDDDTWQSIVEVILLLLQGSMPRPLNLNFPLFHF